jgi:phosphoglycerol transferase MdoB-like AlkP superfamily enzyme
MPMIQKIWLHFRYCRYRFILVILTATLIFFSVKRLFLYFITRADYAECSIDQLFTAFIRGVHFDFVVAAMLAAPLGLLFLITPPRFDRNPLFRLLVSILAGFIATLILIACTIDFFFFLEFGSRLDIKVVQYIHYDYIHKILIEDFYILHFLSGCLLLLIGVSLVFYKKVFPAPLRPTSWINNFTVFLLINAILALGIRGSLGPKPINSGPAFFSPSTELAQLTLNGLFTLREALYSHIASSQLTVDYLYGRMPNENAFRIAQAVLETKQDRFLNLDDNPVERITDTGRPQNDCNVMLVIMESISWHYIETMGGMPRLTPHLDRLIRDGIFMTNCFSVGTRTTRGVSGAVAGFPDLPGASITTREASLGNIQTIGGILKERGYNTLFIYAGQPYYDHRQSFLGSNGFTGFVFENQFPQKTFRTHLGWCDEDLFMAAHKTFTERKKPLFAVLLTLSFHRNYKIPEGKIRPVYPDHPHADQLQCVQYTDWAIGRLMEKARQADYFNNTIFVFTADHGGGFLGRGSELTSMHVPFLIYAPGVIGSKGRKIDQVCSQTDIPPTIMDLLGGQYRHSFFGSSVLSRPSGKGAALLQDSSGVLSYISGESYLVRVVPHQTEVVLYRYQPPDSLVPLEASSKNTAVRLELKNQCLSLIQTAEFLYYQQTYRSGRVAGVSPDL